MIIYGKNPVLEMLRRNPELVLRVSIKAKTPPAAVHDIATLAQKHKISLTKITTEEIHGLVGDVNHQSVLAEVKYFDWPNLDDWLENSVTEKSKILLLDSIEDVHNFGAIVRSATAAGIDAIVVGKHKQAPINAGVYRTAAGTVGRIPIIRVGNLVKTIEQIKQHDFWVYGLAMKGSENLFELDPPARSAFVIGNEGRGLRSLVQKKCDGFVHIPMRHDVESLNASVSAALVSYHVTQSQ